MFAHQADVYAPDDAPYTREGGMLRGTTDIQRLAPHSNVPAAPSAINPLLAAAGLVALIYFTHKGLGGKKR